ncbi:cell division protein SepF [Vallitalea okinawensis]|uniref:cell division protein SepF n=1 Tax=Vallitalea okinawensis TaxID=2078660 RepID=UPI000CFD0CD8|nr:cell division protein SepF [Vallitalea okinawensis]
MSKFVDKMFNAFGLVEYEEEEYEEIEEIEDDTDDVGYSNVSAFSSSAVKKAKGNKDGKSSKIVNIHTNIQMEVVVTNPATFEEAKEICRHIVEKKPVVINLENVDHAIAQRITDFVCGACYALTGNIQRVTNNIYIIAPDNVDFAGDIDIKEELETNGIILPWKKV